MKKTQFPLKHSLCSFLLLIGIVNPMKAQVKELTKEVSSQGKTAGQAVANGLIEAVNQIEGLTIDSSKTIRSSLRKIDTANKGKNPNIKSLSSNSFKENVLLKSKGLVKSYTVKRIHEKKDGSWEATLTVTVPSYIPLDQNKSQLRRIAVTLFRTAEPQFAFGSSQLNAANISRRLNQKLVTQLTQAGKLRVLDQQFDQEVTKHLERLGEDKTPLKELSRLGQRLGTDYLVTGTINQFNLKQQVNRPGFGLPDEAISTANAIVEFRVIEVATQQILWSNEANLIFNNNDLLKLVPQFNVDQLKQAILGRASDEIANEILDIIHPIKVMDTGEQIVLNQGGKRVRLGTYYKIEGLGKTVLDPDTGLPIKIRGSKTSTVVITEVQPKYSIAKLVAGNKDVKLGQVCRRTQVKIVPATASEAK